MKLLQKMHHPMIIGYYDYFIFENQLAIVMQYAEGGTMEKLVQDQKGEARLLRVPVYFCSSYSLSKECLLSWFRYIGNAVIVTTIICSSARVRPKPILVTVSHCVGQANIHLPPRYPAETEYVAPPMQELIVDVLYRLPTHKPGWPLSSTPTWLKASYEGRSETQAPKRNAGAILLDYAMHFAFTWQCGFPV